MRQAAVVAVGLFILATVSGCYTYEGEEVFGGMRLLSMSPTSDAYGSAAGIGVEGRRFGEHESRTGQDARHLWTYSIDALRYDRKGSSETDEVFIGTVSTGLHLHPVHAVYLRAGLAYVSHKAASGEKERGVGAELALGWMLPVSSFDIGLELATLWAKPGADVLDATGARLGLYYCTEYW